MRSARMVVFCMDEAYYPFKFLNRALNINHIGAYIHSATVYLQELCAKTAKIAPLKPTRRRLKNQPPQG